MINRKIDKPIQQAANTAIESIGKIAGKARHAVNGACSLANQMLGKTNAAMASRAQDAARRCRTAVSAAAQAA